MGLAQGDEEIARQIARARSDGYDTIAVDALKIADDRKGDVPRDKLRVETRLKLLAKWDPKRYGDRQILAGDPDAPLHTSTTTRLEDLTDEQLAQIAARGAKS